MEKYKVFLGSEIAKTYDEAKNFTLARVETCKIGRASCRERV